MISFIIYKTFKICKEYNVKNYLSLTEVLVGDNRIVNYTINNIINIFLLISYIVMVAGVGAFFKQELGINCILGALVITILALIIFKRNLDGLEKINLFLIPFIIVAIFFLYLNGNHISLSQISKINNNGWLLKSILYASYNSIILIPIIVTFSKKISSNIKILLISVITFLIMLTMSFSIFMVVQVNYDIAVNTEMPIVKLASEHGIVYRYIYSFVVLGAIFTTAISSGYSFLNNCSNSKKQYKVLSYVISIFAIVLSSIGFGKLLELLYPILGFLGLIQIGVLIKR